MKAPSFDEYSGKTIALVAEYDNAHYAMTSQISSGKIQSVPVQLNAEGYVIALCSESDFNSIRWYVGGSKNKAKLYKYVLTNNSYEQSTKDFLVTKKGNFVIGTAYEQDSKKNDITIGYNETYNSWAFKAGSEYNLPLLMTNANPLVFKAEPEAFIQSQGYIPASNRFLAEHAFRDLPADEGDYGTICFRGDVRSDEVAGATFYEITHRVEDNGVCSGIILKAVTGTLRAGRPYIFRRANDSPFLAAALSGELVEEAEARNGLVGTFTPMTAPAGTYLLRHGVLVPADTQGDVLLRAGEAYIDISQIAATQTGTEAASIAVQKDRGLIVGLGRCADATRRLSPALPRFDLSGRRATTLRRGLYVTGGRKVIVQ